MASRYEYQGLHFHVFQPANIVPEPHYPAPLFVQLEVTVTLEVNIIRHYCSINHLTRDAQPLIFSQETRRFDLHIVKDRYRVTEILGSMLIGLGLSSCSLVFNVVLRKLIRYGLELSNCTSSMGRIVLPLHADLWGNFVEHVNFSETGSISRALEESESQYETSSYGMLSAKESSVKEMLKRVRAEGVEGCVICLEELEVGSDASQMPCSHTFHENCIQKWLKQSHCCPICRFELPT
ncbi:E3 ubiquitin-protein ligase At4g11680-like [Herrania umbratica]|uniref:RING-type E3 ubiquitin transferase n=1 Tax=Herrania umbratica TaxID=108875 RepID=A0A6J1B410_9ROSI|nr:E3 ubiquitin-protein ligase At4g11680-like [Herrania umbratica]